jgi:hypothetical protein
LFDCLFVFFVDVFVCSFFYLAAVLEPRKKHEQGPRSNFDM